MTRPTIALLTDFGTTDSYVGVVKAVIAQLAPGIATIDLTHEVPPGDIRSGAFQLWRSARYFAAGTVFLCVVDPGVGTARRGIAVRFADFTFVGPDNGLLSYLLAAEEHPTAVELVAPEYRLEQVSATFHGRDIFAPAAAHLARGVRLESLGPQVRDPVRFTLPRLSLAERDKIEGEVLHVDRFGNLVTSIGLVEVDQDMARLIPWLPGCEDANIYGSEWNVRLPNGTAIRLRNTFGDVLDGEPVAFVGSDGLIELAVRGGRADKALTLSVGERVEFLPRE
jgi:S-adenosylmethionine hydrolase